MSLLGEIEEAKKIWQQSGWPIRALIVLSMFLMVNSVASLSDVVFEWKGFILDGLEFYRRWVTEPIRSVTEAVGLTYGENEIDRIMVASITFFSMTPLSVVLEARDNVRHSKNELEVIRAGLEKPKELLKQDRERLKQHRELIEQYRAMVEQLKARAEPYTGTFEEYDAPEELLEEQEEMEEEMEEMLAKQAGAQSKFLELERSHYSFRRTVRKFYKMYAGGFLILSAYAAIYGLFEMPSRWYDLPFLLCIYLWVGYIIDNRKRYFAPGIVAVSIVLLLGAINVGLTRT
jgi:hypothetical protein